MGGPGYEMAAGDGRGRLRASHADRERVIGTLKAAYVYGLVTKDELDERVSQTFAARSCAELAVITADIPPGLALPPLPLRPAPAKDSAPAAARDRTIMATAILAGLAWVAAMVSPVAGPGPSVAGALSGLLFAGGTGSALVSLFLLGIRMRSQRTPRRGSQLPPRRRRVDSGTSAAHKTISATSAERLSRAAKPRRSNADAARRHSVHPQLSS
jgi:Domain of unknown function (DUF1707)